MLITTAYSACTQEIKIGFVATFGGPAAAIGTDMRDAFELALDYLDLAFGDD